MKKAFTKLSLLIFPSILLVGILLLTVGPVKSGTASCKILPDTAADRNTYCPTCGTGGTVIAECPVQPTPGASGCGCAEQWCTYWCDNDICDWSQHIKVCRSVCNVNENMPHCVGLVTCPTAGAPCEGENCGYVATGGCCKSGAECPSGQCTISSWDCYNAATNGTTPGLKCDCAITGGTCLISADCCSSNNVCINGICSPDSCTDSDGGVSLRVKGHVYGYLNGNSYWWEDYCTSTNYMNEYYCSGNRWTSSIYRCESGTCDYMTDVCVPTGGGGCPTLFVYDGKEYKKEKISSIHSQEGIDTVDGIELTVKPTVENGEYKLKLIEQFFPGHSYIDSVRLLVDGEEAKLISAKHSEYGDATEALAKSDDVRTDTKLWDEIELKFDASKTGNFVFEIEGYNPLKFPRKIAYGISSEQLIPIVLIAALAIIAIIYFVFKFMAKKV